MSIENNIQRIADALEALVAHVQQANPQLLKYDPTPKRTRGKNTVAAGVVHIGVDPGEGDKTVEATIHPVTGAIEPVSLGADERRVVGAPAPAAPAPAAPAAAPAAPAPAAAAAAAPAPAAPTKLWTQNELNAELVAAYNRIGAVREPIDKLLQSFGAQSIRDLKPEQYDAVMTAARLIGVAQ
jgi:hypothetical protein